LTTKSISDFAAIIVAHSITSSASASNLARVTSVDWQTYPILDIKDAPEAIDIVVVESKNDRPGGAGEPALVAMPAAVANAIYNATAKRIRAFLGQSG
jgi:CO/xanthine dehydrogenase Mo-binding subunit